MAPTKAVRWWSEARDGFFWRGQCPDCTWTSRELPFPSKEEAWHAVDLHKVLCKGPKV